MAGETTLTRTATTAQELTARRAANHELLTSIPDRCRNCFTHLQVGVLGGLATGIAMGEITLDEGHAEVVSTTADCPGLQPDTAQADGSDFCPQAAATA